MLSVAAPSAPRHSLCSAGRALASSANEPIVKGGWLRKYKSRCLSRSSAVVAKDVGHINNGGSAGGAASEEREETNHESCTAGDEKNVCTCVCVVIVVVPFWPLTESALLLLLLSARVRRFLTARLAKGAERDPFN